MALARYVVKFCGDGISRLAKPEEHHGCKSDQGRRTSNSDLLAQTGFSIGGTKTVLPGVCQSWAAAIDMAARHPLVLAYYTSRSTPTPPELSRLTVVCVDMRWSEMKLFALIFDPWPALKVFCCFAMGHHRWVFFLFLLFGTPG